MSTTVWGANRPLHMGETSRWRIVQEAKRPEGEPSWWQNVLGANRPGGEPSRGRNVYDWGRNVQGAKRQSGETSCYRLTSLNGTHVFSGGLLRPEGPKFEATCRERGGVFGGRCSEPPPHQLGAWGSAVSTPSWGLGQNPDRKYILDLLRA